MSMTHEQPTYEARRSPKQKKIDVAVLARVKAGMALLQEQYGPGWEDHIDLKMLSLDDVNLCVLGQLYEGHQFSEQELKANPYLQNDTDGYEKGCVVLGLDMDSPEEEVEPYGFYDSENYTLLTAAWKQELEPRVSQP